MNHAFPPRRKFARQVPGVLLVLFLCHGSVGAEGPPGEVPVVDFSKPLLLPPDLTVPSVSIPSPPRPANRLRLFRIQPGFLSEPPGLDMEDSAPASGDDGPDWVNLAFGNDNPYFDFRRRRDPGGVGFMRVQTQVALFDTSRTCCALGFQAVTPAGLEENGIPDSRGTTVVSPAFSLFHELEDGTAIQAYVGRNLPVMNTAAQTVCRDLQYGMAVQRSLGDGFDYFRCWYVSVGALGQYRLVRETRPPMQFELVPGLHYRMADNWWISGGVSLPVGAAKTETGQQWQVTCALQF